MGVEDCTRISSIGTEHGVSIKDQRGERRARELAVKVHPQKVLVKRVIDEIHVFWDLGIELLYFLIFVNELTKMFYKTQLISGLLYLHGIIYLMY